jgi:uncharacterized membrane protein
VGAYPIFRFAKEKLKSTFFALALSVTYLLSFAVQYPLTFDFHLATIAASILPWILWTMEKKQWVFFAILCCVASGCKEDMPMYIAGLGFYLLITKKNSKLGLLLAIMAIAYTLYITKIVMPSLAHFTVKTYYFPYFELTPNFFFSLFFDSPIKIKTMLFSFVNYLGLPLLSGPFLILPVIHFFLNFANHDFPERWGLFMHYRSYIGPIMTFGMVMGYSYLMKKNPKVFAKLRSMYVTGMLLLITTITLEAFLHLPINTLAKPGFYYQEPWIADINRVVSKIPIDAYLLTTNHLFPQTAFREHIFQYPKNLEQAEYILLDTRKNQPIINYWLTANSEDEFQSKVYKLLHTQGFPVVYSSGEILLLQRDTSVDITNFSP